MIFHHGLLFLHGRESIKKAVLFYSGEQTPGGLGKTLS
jgi:hypothetical protein